MPPRPRRRHCVTCGLRGSALADFTPTASLPALPKWTSKKPPPADAIVKPGVLCGACYLEVYAARQRMGTDETRRARFAAAAARAQEHVERTAALRRAKDDIESMPTAATAAAIGAPLPAIKALLESRQGMESTHEGSVRADDVADDIDRTACWHLAKQGRREDMEHLQHPPLSASLRYSDDNGWAPLHMAIASMRGEFYEIDDAALRAEQQAALAQAAYLERAAEMRVVSEAMVETSAVHAEAAAAFAQADLYVRANASDAFEAAARAVAVAVDATTPPDTKLLRDIEGRLALWGVASVVRATAVAVDHPKRQGLVLARVEYPWLDLPNAARAWHCDPKAVGKAANASALDAKAAGRPASTAPPWSVEDVDLIKKVRKGVDNVLIRGHNDFKRVRAYAKADVAGKPPPGVDGSWPTTADVAEAERLMEVAKSSSRAATNAASAAQAVADVRKAEKGALLARLKRVAATARIVHAVAVRGIEGYH